MISLSLIKAQVTRIFTLNEVLALTALSILPVVAVGFVAGTQISFGNASEAQTIDSSSGMVLSAYVIAGLGSFIALMGFQTNEDVYLLLASGKTAKSDMAKIYAAIFVVSVTAVLVLLLNAVVAFVNHTPIDNPVGTGLSFYLSALMFFWFGSFLTALTRSVLVAMAFICLMPLLMTPFFDRVIPKTNTYLPWSILHDSVGSPSLLQISVSLLWSLFFIVGYVLIERRNR